MRTALVTLSLCLSWPIGAGQAIAKEGIVECEAFKVGWSGAMQMLEANRPALAYSPVPDSRGEGMRVTGLGAGIDGRFACSDGLVSHVEVTQATSSGGTGLAPFARAAAAILIAFDRDLTPAQAGNMVGALQAEAQPGRDANSTWGPFEITVSRTPQGGASFVADFPEN